MRYGKDYARARANYMEAHPDCERCKQIGHEIHHKKGRSGELMINQDYFMTVCRPCHIWIELHPKMAKELGYSLSRLGND